MAGELPIRINILNWRCSGEPESYIRTEIFDKDEPGDCQGIVIAEALANERPITFIEDEMRTDNSLNLAYINDDMEIRDGQIMKSRGREFLINITEVK